jgi:hypothetical protein
MLDISLKEVRVMNRIFTAIVLIGILFTCGSVAQAQFNGGPRYDAHSVTDLVDRVHTDLDHAYGTFHFSNDDRERLNHAEKDLREFAQTWDQGKFEVGRLDDAIASIQHVLDNNKLPETDRAAISDDVAQLRKMREAYKNREIA